MINQFISVLKDSRKSLAQFLRQHKILIIITIVAVLFAYGAKIAWFSFSIDTEDLLNDLSKSHAIHIALQRYGSVFIDRLLGLSGNIFLRDILATTTLIILSIVVSFIVWKVKGIKKRDNGLVILSLLFTTSPIIAEQYIFSSQSFQVFLGALLVAIAVFLVSQTRQTTLPRIKLTKSIRKNLLVYTTSVLLSAFAFSIYQSIFIFFIAMAAILLAVSKNVYEHRKFWRKALEYVMVFLVAFAVYYALPYVHSLWVYGDLSHVGIGYITSSITWGIKPFGEIMQSIWDYINLNFGSESLYIGWSALCVIIVLSIVISWQAFARKNKASVINQSICILVMLLSMIAIYIILGSDSPIRSLFPTVPFVIAFLFYLAISSAPQKWLATAIIASGIILSFAQMRTTADMLFAEHIKFREEEFITSRIIGRLDQLGFSDYDNYDLAIIGQYQFKSKPLVTELAKGRHDVLTGSFYSWDIGIMQSTHRVLGFMETKGIYFKSGATHYLRNFPSKYKVILQKYKETLPHWPAAGSVVIDDEEKVIVVNF
ncbi:glucosyltransferase domain-containing protein [Candidatus Saccharibacteria bacterium]|nr:glucosyltransferase domain-containing protein [Candidatus Saccharibacteria bacterium]